MYCKTMFRLNERRRTRYKYRDIGARCAPELEKVRAHISTLKRLCLPFYCTVQKSFSGPQGSVHSITWGCDLQRSAVALSYQHRCWACCATQLSCSMAKNSSSLGCQDAPEGHLVMMLFLRERWWCWIQQQFIVIAAGFLLWCSEKYLLGYDMRNREY
jgi:hypothetical protein